MIFAILIVFVPLCGKLFEWWGTNPIISLGFRVLKSVSLTSTYTPQKNLASPGWMWIPHSPNLPQVV